MGNGRRGGKIMREGGLRAGRRRWDEVIQGL
jgi:hypothetical protein